MTAADPFDPRKRILDQLTELYAQWRTSPQFDSSDPTQIFVADLAQLTIALAAVTR